MLQSLLFFANDALGRAANNSPPLARGSEGDAVRCLQLGLFALGFALPISVKKRPLSADGEFGPETDRVVRHFQRRQGLTADGVAGRHTLTRLDLLLRTGRDPLVSALRDLRRLGVGVVQAEGNAPTARREFEQRLLDADALALGNPVKLIILLKHRLPYL
jgi:peptidoglycan hydrolase-like protein with peptidoglycan-binding domain